MEGCAVRRDARATVASPAVGASNVESIRWVVVLPAPFGPRNPTTSRALMAKSTPATAATGPVRVWKVRPRPRASTIGCSPSPAI